MRGNVTKEKPDGKLGKGWNFKALLLDNPSSEPPLGTFHTPLHDAAAKSAGSTRALKLAQKGRSRAANLMRHQRQEDGEFELANGRAGRSACVAWSSGSGP